MTIRFKDIELDRYASFFIGGDYFNGRFSVTFSEEPKFKRSTSHCAKFNGFRSIAGKILDWNANPKGI